MKKRIYFLISIILFIIIVFITLFIFRYFNANLSTSISDINIMNTNYMPVRSEAIPLFFIENYEEKVGKERKTAPPGNQGEPLESWVALIRLALAGDARATFPGGEGFGCGLPHQCEHWFAMTASIEEFAMTAVLLRFG